MLDPGLTAPRFKELMWRLATGCQIKTTVQLLTPEHAVVRTVSNTLIDGQVDVTTPTFNSGDIEVSRTASLTFVDRDRSLALDSTSPTDGAFYMDRMVRVIYSVLCSWGWVDLPVFTGPIVKVDRDGDLIDVECQGKEWYALGDAWVGGTEEGKKVDVMRKLLQRCGESTRYMDFPDAQAKVAKPVAIGRESTLWSHVWRVNSSMPSRVIFYDGRGVCRSVPRPTKPAVTLRLQDGGFLLGEPQLTYSTSDLVNAVYVEGVKKSKGRTPHASATADINDPLAFRRNNKRGRVEGEFIQNSDLKSTPACRRVAVAELKRGLMQHVDASLQCLPLPLLEPWDIVQISTERVSLQIQPKAFTLPLVQDSTTGTPMTIGALVNVRKPRRPIRKA